MQLFADFSGDLNKNKKPLWTIYHDFEKVKYRNIYFFYQRRKRYLVPGVSFHNHLDT